MTQRKHKKEIKREIKSECKDYNFSQKMMRAVCSDCYKVVKKLEDKKIYLIKRLQNDKKI